jgi:hypothetical protein
MSAIDHYRIDDAPKFFWPTPLEYFLFSDSILHGQADHELYLLDEKRNDADTIIRSVAGRSS